MWVLIASTVKLFSIFYLELNQFQSWSAQKLVFVANFTGESSSNLFAANIGASQCNSRVNCILHIVALGQLNLVDCDGDVTNSQFSSFNSISFRAGLHKS
ncbi:hypothetical protein LINPERHAP2_LOCUS11277 [Linum perenne]